jgi:hypothetical protein
MHQRFDVTRNLKKFCKILITKHALSWWSIAERNRRLQGTSRSVDPRFLSGTGSGFYSGPMRRFGWDSDPPGTRTERGLPAWLCQPSVFDSIILVLTVATGRLASLRACRPAELLLDPSIHPHSTWRSIELCCDGIYMIEAELWACCVLASYPISFFIHGKILASEGRDEMES